MLEHLRQRVIQTLAHAKSVTLSTDGPAGLQSSRLMCEPFEIGLLVLIPRTSDHLFNLETNPNVVVVNELWSLRGVAHLIAPEKLPPTIQLTQAPAIQWSALIEIRPHRVQIFGATPSDYSETIDINQVAGHN